MKENKENNKLDANRNENSISQFFNIMHDSNAILLLFKTKGFLKASYHQVT